MDREKATLNCFQFSLNIFKTINSGDGGMVVTNDKSLYEIAFSVHDQGHKPMRFGIEVGTINVLGLNLRMNELNAAVALAQLAMIDKIITALF